jgi:hypothetical protein
MCYYRGVLFLDRKTITKLAAEGLVIGRFLL